MYIAHIFKPPFPLPLLQLSCIQLPLVLIHFILVYLRLRVLYLSSHTPLFLIYNVANNPFIFSCSFFIRLHYFLLPPVLFLQPRYFLFAIRSITFSLSVINLFLSFSSVISPFSSLPLSHLFDYIFLLKKMSFLFCFLPHAFIPFLSVFFGHLPISSPLKRSLIKRGIIFYST